MSPSVFVTLYKYWTWLGIPMMALGAAALAFEIAGVVSLTRKSRLLAVPLAEHQEVQFAAAERVVLNIEGPLLTTRFARVSFEMRSIDGEPIAGHRAWFRARSSGLSKARMELLKFDLPRAGRYVLTMKGLGPVGPKDAVHSVVFTRPHLGRMVGYIVGIVLASVLTIVSLVFFLLRLREPGIIIN